VPPDKPSLGPWEDDRESLAAAPIDGAGLYSDQPERLQFQTLAMRLLRAQLSPSRGKAAEQRSTAYIVLGTQDVFEAVRKTSTSVPLLRTGKKELSGRLWFVPRELGHGYAIDVRDRTPEEVFLLVEQLGAGGQPAVVCDPTTDALAYVYSSGISTPHDISVRHLDQSTVEPQQITDALDGLYALIRSPDQTETNNLWKNAPKWWPVHRAEKAIQHDVTRALAGRFFFLDVRMEQPSSVGRTDVELIDTQSHEPGLNIRHALIELKVLRSFGSTGKSVSDAVNARQLREGLRQAVQYGRANNSKIRMLACYDMRRTDLGDESCFRDIATRATAAAVLLQRYFLYHSSAALREALEASAGASC
jgi:hypothetical protein